MAAFGLCDPFSAKCTNGVVIYVMHVNRDTVYKFLVGLNQDFDQI